MQTSLRTPEGQARGNLSRNSPWFWVVRIACGVFLLAWWVHSFEWAAKRAAAAAIILLALRLAYSALKRRLGNNRPPALALPPDDTHGSARWAAPADLERHGYSFPGIGNDRYLLGVWRESVASVPGLKAALTTTVKAGWGRQQEFYYPLVTTRPKANQEGVHADDGHVITIAGSGAGKGVAVVKPNLLSYQGPVIVLDPKGENFAATAGPRIRMGHRVMLVDPFGVGDASLVNEHRARFNPLQSIAESCEQGRHSDAFDDASAIAEMMVFTSGNESQPHFNEKAKGFIRAAILFVAYADVYQEREKYPLTLVTVKDAIGRWFGSPKTIELFVAECRKSPHLGFAISELSMIAGEERNSVLSTVQRHTDFLNSPAVRESLSGADFRFADIKRGGLSIYLVLPANRMVAYRNLARVWIGTLMQAVQQDLTRPQHRVLFMLDEMAQLGRMEVLIQAVSLARGYGVDMWMLFQDINQIKSAYGDAWGTFFGNAKYQQFFGIRDIETAKYVSERLGKSTRKAVSTSTSLGSSSGSGSNYTGTSYSDSSSSSTSWNDSTSYSVVGRELLQPNEVMALDDGEVLVLISDRPPIRARKFDTRIPEIAEALIPTQCTPVMPSAPAADKRIAAGL
jgi:type IV secretion system protein VirD4